MGTKLTKSMLIGKLKQLIFNEIEKLLTNAINDLIQNGIAKLVGKALNSNLGQKIKEVLKDGLKTITTFLVEASGILKTLENTIKGEAKKFIGGIVRQATGGSLHNMVKNLVEGIKEQVKFSEIEKLVKKELNKLVESVTDKIGEGGGGSFEKMINETIQPVVNQLKGLLKMEMVKKAIAEQIRKLDVVDPLVLPLIGPIREKVETLLGSAIELITNKVNATELKTMISKEMKTLTEGLTNLFPKKVSDKKRENIIFAYALL